jgi:hypothetical protein
MTVAEYTFKHADHVAALIGFAGALVAGTASLGIIEGLLFATAYAFFTLIVASLYPPNGDEPWRGPQQ